MQRLIRSGGVFVNGTPVISPSYEVSPNDDVHVRLPESIPEDVTLRPEAIDLDIVFEDEHLLVVDKPAGLAVHPGAGRTDGTLANALIHRFPNISQVGDPERPGIVHRLDADTSGLMVVARTPSARASLSEAIRTRSVDRRYVALVAGRPRHSAAVIEAPIRRDAGNPTRQAVNPSGRPARTRYRITQTFGQGARSVSLLELKLETGRMHQIRVHLQSIGHPVVGDETYGARIRLPGLTRQFLHAYRLAFTHPSSGEMLRFESPLPDDLSNALKSVKNSSS